MFIMDRSHFEPSLDASGLRSDVISSIKILFLTGRNQHPPKTAAGALRRVPPPRRFREVCLVRIETNTSPNASDWFKRTGGQGL